MLYGSELHDDAILLPEPSKLKRIFPSALVVEVYRPLHTRIDAFNRIGTIVCDVDGHGSTYSMKSRCQKIYRELQVCATGSCVRLKHGCYFALQSRRYRSNLGGPHCKGQLDFALASRLGRDPYGRPCGRDD